MRATKDFFEQLKRECIEKPSSLDGNDLYCHNIDLMIKRVSDAINKDSISVFDIDWKEATLYEKEYVAQLFEKIDLSKIEVAKKAFIAKLERDLLTADWYEGSEVIKYTKGVIYVGCIDSISIKSIIDNIHKSKIDRADFEKNTRKESSSELECANNRIAELEGHVNKEREEKDNEITRLKQQILDKDREIEKLKNQFAPGNYVTLDEIEENLMGSPDWATAKDRIDAINKSEILAKTKWAEVSTRIRSYFKQKAEEHEEKLSKVATRPTVGSIILEQNNNGITPPEIEQIHHKEIQ